MIKLLSKVTKKKMTEPEWSELIQFILDKSIDLEFKFEENKNKACLNDIVLLEYDGENLFYLNGFKECFICNAFKQFLVENSFYSPIMVDSIYSFNSESVEIASSFSHRLEFKDCFNNIVPTLKKIDMESIPVRCRKEKWGVYSVSLISQPALKSMNTSSLCKASILCLAISILSSAQADDKLQINSENGIDKVAKKMNETIKDNYRINPLLQQQMEEDPNFDKSRVVNYKRAGNQAINDYIKNDTGVYPALKRFEQKIEDFFNGDNALENREEFKKNGSLPKNITADLTDEDALQVETQLKTQVLKGQARLKISTSIGEISTEARAFGGEVFRASARTKALELKEFGIQVQGTVDYRNSEINSAIRTRINPNTSFHMENVRSVASEGKTDNRVRLNYDIDF